MTDTQAVQTPDNVAPVLVVDFGAQYAQLIARRVREARIYSEVIPHSATVDEIKAKNPAALILSGGPASVYAEDAPSIDPALMDLDVPVFGICYGYQCMAAALGGEVANTGGREFGRTPLRVTETDSVLLAGQPAEQPVWMSHNDAVQRAPEGFTVTASTEGAPVAAFENLERQMAGVQYHPEVIHTPHGQQVLTHFLYDIAGLEPTWTAANIAETLIDQVREQVGENDLAICGLSGGVDSAVAAALVQRAIGDRLTCVFVDHGLLRAGEREQVQNDFVAATGARLVTVDAAETFLTDVSTRFGTDAVVAHRSARALPTRPVSARGPDADLVVEYRCDPLLEFVEAAAFVGRRLADDLHQRLLAANVACTRLTVRAVTASATSYARTWRCVRPMTPEDTADRIRWQLEGWMSGRNAPRPDAPIAVLRLEPVEVIDAAEMQYGFSGAGLPSDNETQERVRRALVRVQGLLGGDAVRVPVRSGGRGPAEQVTMVALGDEPAAARDPSLPWPGRLGGPSPAVLSSEPVEVLDAAGSPVRVTTRGGFSADPVSLCWGRRSWSVRWWTGPWSADEKWWMPGNDGVTSRAQVLLDDSRALLLRHERSAWVVEGVYE